MKYLQIIILFFVATNSYSDDWIEVGKPLSKPDFNSSNIESELWAYLNTMDTIQFEPEESYRFQYKFVKANEIHINAICSPKGSESLEVGAFPQPTDEELAREFYEVFDGGSCFFRLNYNINTKEFSGLSVNGNA